MPVPSPCQFFQYSYAHAAYDVIARLKQTETALQYDSFNVTGVAMARFEGLPLPKKLWLVRQLLEERTKRSLFGRLFLTGRQMSDQVVIGTPEGTIVTIVETYCSLLASGFSSTEAFARIESHRSTVMPGKMPNCANLEDYVKFRVRLEHKRGRQISDDDIGRATFITGEFIVKYCLAPDPAEGKAAAPIQDEEGDDEASINPYFISQLPHPDVNRSLGEFKTGDLLLRYYENPRTIGSIVAGIEPPYGYPQAAVILDQEHRPIMIVRSEQSALGGFFLCLLDVKGVHENWGDVTVMGRDAFVKRVVELLETKHGDPG